MKEVPQLHEHVQRKKNLKWVREYINAEQNLYIYNIYIGLKYRLMETF